MGLDLTDVSAPDAPAVVFRSVGATALVSLEAFQQLPFSVRNVAGPIAFSILTGALYDGVPFVVCPGSRTRT